MAGYIDRYFMEVPEPYQDIDFLYRPPHWSMDEHDHPWYQAILLVDGELQLRCEDAAFRLYGGQCCIIPPFHNHALFTEVGFHQLGINLLSVSDQRGILDLLETHFMEPVIFNRSDLLMEIKAMDQNSVAMTPLARQQLAHLSDRVLLACVEDITEDQGNREFRGKLLAYMESQMHRKLHLYDVTQWMAMSQTQLERMTRKAFGCGAIALFNRLRIVKACTLLAESDLSMDTISAELGFYDQAHFSRYFKKQMKVSPSRYRSMKHQSF